jgi:hypothetical protein
MLWDGIFNTALGKQLVGLYLTAQIDANEIDLLSQYQNLTCRYEITAPTASGVVIDPGWSIAIPLRRDGQPAFVKGQQLLHLVEADFSNAQVGKFPLDLRVTVTSDSVTLGSIPAWGITSPVLFVSRIQPNAGASGMMAEMPEGKVNFVHDEAYILAHVPPDGDPQSWQEYVEKTGIDPTLLPKTFTLELTPLAPFSGQFSTLPFADPWWKDAACAAASNYGKAGTTAVVATLCILFPPACPFIAAGGGGVQGLMEYLCQKEDKDIFRIGEENTPVASDERTMKEVVKVNVEYGSELTIGGGMPMHAQWTFERHTDGQGSPHIFSGEWDVDNAFTSGASEVKTDKATYGIGDLIHIEGTFNRADGSPFLGADAYVLAILVGPETAERRFHDVILSDATNSGVFSGDMHVEELAPNPFGEWQVACLVQTVNRYVTVSLSATDQDAIVQQAAIAAHSVGGVVIAPRTVIPRPSEDCSVEQLGPPKCEMDATFLVVQ